MNFSHGPTEVCMFAAAVRTGQLLAATTGTMISTHVPSPGALSMWTVPPTATTRNSPASVVNGPPTIRG